MLRIDNKELLIDKMKKGICLFTGAGFSTIPDDDGNSLPVGKVLAQELMERFNIDKIFENDLQYIADQCPKNELDDYLRKRYTVKSYNKAYDAINLINIKTLVTTNIDNIIQCVVENGNKYYINNMREYGASLNKSNELYFIPLHGNVLDFVSPLYFGAMELTQVTSENKDLFDAMFSRLKKESIVFLGYSFKDAGVMTIVKKLIDAGEHDIWIQCLESDKIQIAYFEKIGCNIIQANTAEILSWINSTFVSNNPNTDKDNDLIELKQYRVPSVANTQVISINEFFQQGNTNWYSVINRIPYERSAVTKVYNDALQKNVIVIGESFTGKTTLLMQLALKVNDINKFYVDMPTKSEAEYICKMIGDNDAWVFIKNCTADIQAFKAFAHHQNIKVVGTSNDYQYDTIRHLIDGEISYKTIDISALSRDEARSIYNILQPSTKQQHFSYKDSLSPNEKYSMFEFIGKNVKDAYTRKRIRNTLKSALQNDIKVFNIIALTAYLTEHYSALSYDIVSAFFNIPTYPNAYNLIQKCKNYLRNYSEYESDSDYYVLRSKLFATNINVLLSNEFKTEYANVIEKFVKNVSPYYILNFDMFKRKGYDADLFYKLFSYEKCNELFLSLCNSVDNCYVLQQWALCKMKFKRYKEAFADIDRALSLAPNNFSISNSRAIILFEANKNVKNDSSLQSLKEAMEILKKCYTNDKRKTYHGQKFTEFAIYLKEHFNCDDYLFDAKEWIDAIAIEQGENVSKQTIRLQQKLNNLL